MSKDDGSCSSKRSSSSRGKSWSGAGSDSGDMPSMQTIPKTKCYKLAVPVQQGAAAAAAKELVVAQAVPVTVSMSVGSIAVAAGDLAAPTVTSTCMEVDGTAAAGAGDAAAAAGAMANPQQQQQRQQQLVRAMELREVPCNIRAAFVAAPGWVILDADYNQIELRVMAHASQDAALMAAFGSACGDVFKALGAKWLQKPEEQVSPSFSLAANLLFTACIFNSLLVLAVTFIKNRLQHHATCLHLISWSITCICTSVRTSHVLSVST
jgi:hypothetical protein